MSAMRLAVYYCAADTSCCVAYSRLDELIAFVSHGVRSGSREWEQGEGSQCIEVLAGAERSSASTHALPVLSPPR